MKTPPPRPPLLLGLALLLHAAAGPARAADDPLATLRTYRYSQGQAIPQAVENAVRAAAGSPAAAEVEQALVGILESDAAFDAKDVACRQLRPLATDRAVPALARLLGDPELNSIARYALQPIPGERAAAALRDATRTVSGEPLVGVINSLGARREPDSVAALTPLLARTDVRVVSATLTALGRIGNEHALDALRAVAAHYDASAADGGLTVAVVLAPEVKSALDLATLLDAFILCADQLEHAGRADYAVQIYARIHDAPLAPMPCRLAALRGLSRLDPPQAAAALAGYLRDAEESRRRAAMGCLATLPASAMPRLLPTFDALPAERLAPVLPILAARRDPTLSGEFLRWSTHPDAAVRTGALAALGDLPGTEASIARLLSVAAGGDGAERDAARESLRRVRGPLADQVLASAATRGDTATRAEAIRVLGPRGAVGAKDSLLAAASDPDGMVRVAALEALTDLAELADQTALLARLNQAGNAPERAAAAKALVAATRRNPDAEGRVAAIIAALPRASTAARPALLEGLAQLGGNAALRAVAAAVNDPSPEIQSAAVNALAGWTDAAATEPLLDVARRTPNPTLRTVALRGYLQLVEQPGRRPLEMLSLYRQALDLATRADERRLVLAGLAQVADPGALELARRFLPDAELKNEAGLAAARIARAIAGSAPSEARVAAEQVLAAPVTEPVKAQARDVIAYLERGEGFILGWELAGPYSKAGATERELFETAFPPESNSEVRWRRVQSEQGVVPLDQLVGGENCVAYLRTTLRSPRPMKIRFELGSDDGVKAWLNGQVIHANNVNRGYLAGEDKFAGELNEGANVLLVKVTQGGGGWTVGVRLVGEDGARLEGLQTGPH